MASMTVQVNGRPYIVGCEDGQETHVEMLARNFDRQIREVADQVGQVGELRLFLMAALVTADELADARARLSHQQAELGRLQSDHARADVRAAAALDAASERIESLAGRLE